MVLRGLWSVLEWFVHSISRDLYRTPARRNRRSRATIGRSTVSLLPPVIIVPFQRISSGKDGIPRACHRARVRTHLRTFIRMTVAKDRRNGRRSVTRKPCAIKSRVINIIYFSHYVERYAINMRMYNVCACTLTPPWVLSIFAHGRRNPMEAQSLLLRNRFHKNISSSQQRRIKLMLIVPHILLRKTRIISSRIASPEKRICQKLIRVQSSRLCLVILNIIILIIIILIIIIY